MVSLGIISLGSVSSQMLEEEAKKHFDEVSMIDIRKVEIRMDSTTKVLYNGEPFEEFDCLYMKGSFRYSTLLFGLSQIFKGKCFVPIDPTAHIIAHNKFMTHLFLAPEKSINMPQTYFAAKMSETKEFLRTLNYPKILKFPSGTHGKGVIFTESFKSASSMLDALDIFKQPLLVQDYINIKSDIRIIVAGNKVIGSMRRIAKSDDIRANAHQGGSAEPYIPTSEIKRMAIDAAKRLKSGIAGVDFIESEFGPLILEVNTSPGLQKITEVTKKNIAGEMAKYLYDETKRLRDEKDKVSTKGVMTDLGIEEIGSRDFQTSLKVNAERIVLPDFAYKMSNFKEGEEVTIKVNKNKIEIVRNEENSEMNF